MLAEEKIENTEKEKVLRKISPYKVILPIIIGLGVIVFMLIRDTHLDRLQVSLLNVNTKNQKWMAFESNLSHDTITCIIQDSLVSKKDTLKLELKYFITGKKKTFHITDTLSLAVYPYKPVQNPDNYLKSAIRTSADTCVFVFTSPVRNPMSAFRITWYNIIFIILAWSMMLLRDFGYMWRIRILSDNALSWWQSFRVIMLWEFSSAVMPSAVGGTSVAVLFVTKEGIPVGRSTIIILLTSFLDEVYFVIMLPLVFLFISAKALFTIAGREVSYLTNEFFYLAIVSYSIILIYTLLLGYGLFRNPQAIKWILIKAFKLPFLKKWSKSAEKAGDDLITCSEEFKTRSFKFWLKAFGSTFFAWTGRYWIVNFLLLAFVPVQHHFLIFGRQLVMWKSLLVLPTPGGSGVSEFLFKYYLGEFITPITLAVVLALIWRLITYYPYLIMGAVLVPRWVKNKFT